MRVAACRAAVHSRSASSRSELVVAMRKKTQSLLRSAALRLVKGEGTTKAVPDEEAGAPPEEEEEGGGKHVLTHSLHAEVGRREADCKVANSMLSKRGKDGVDAWGMALAEHDVGVTRVARKKKKAPVLFYCRGREHSHTCRCQPPASATESLPTAECTRT